MTTGGPKAEPTSAQRREPSGPTSAQRRWRDGLGGEAIAPEEAALWMAESVTAMAKAHAVGLVPREYDYTKPEDRREYFDIMREKGLNPWTHQPYMQIGGHISLAARRKAAKTEEARAMLDAEMDMEEESTPDESTDEAS